MKTLATVVALGCLLVGSTSARAADEPNPNHYDTSLWITYLSPFDPHIDVRPQTDPFAIGPFTFLAAEPAAELDLRAAPVDLAEVDARAETAYPVWIVADGAERPALAGELRVSEAFASDRLVPAQHRFVVASPVIDRAYLSGQPVGATLLVGPRGFLSDPRSRAAGLSVPLTPALYAGRAAPVFGEPVWLAVAVASETLRSLAAGGAYDVAIVLTVYDGDVRPAEMELAVEAIVRVAGGEQR